MNIWLLDPAQLTPYYNIALCNALASAGCRVRYIASVYLYDEILPFGDNFQTDYLYFRALENPMLVKLPWLRRLLRGISYPLGHWQLLHQIGTNPPDVLHIQWSRLPRIDSWLVRQVRQLGIPVVHTVHDVKPLFAHESSTSSLEQVYKQIDAIILHTEANRYEFQKVYRDVLPDRLSVIPFITSSYTAIPPNASQNEARKKLGLPLNVPILLFFGGIRWYKGLDILVKAFQQISVSHLDIHLIIAGRPESSEDQSILELASQQSNIHVYSGYIPYPDMWIYYLAADLAVLPYRAITQSAALMTAMEFGRAVIVTAVGGLPESVDGNGWVVSPENAEALAAAIVEAVADRERLHKMGERSVALVRERYDGSAIARQTIQLYEQVLKRSHSTGKNKS